MEQNSDATLRFARLLFYVALGGWFYVIGCWLGPNEITFHKLEGMTTADFVPIAQKYCVPVVREIKIYRRDLGSARESNQELGDILNSHQKDGGPGGHSIGRDGSYEYYGFGVMFRHTITYDFTPGHEGWSVHGAFANGPIPMPPVTLEPGANPAVEK